MVNKKKTIEELEMELTELIGESGRCEQDILTDFNDYRALKKRSNIPGSIFNDHHIRRMKDLHPAFLLGKSIEKKQGKIRAARKAAATAATAASSNAVNTSISSIVAAADSSTSSSTIGLA
jgi:hypothetical protein